MPIAPGIWATGTRTPQTIPGGICLSGRTHGGSRASVRKQTHTFPSPQHGDLWDTPKGGSQGNPAHCRQLSPPSPSSPRRGTRSPPLFGAMSPGSPQHTGAPKLQSTPPPPDTPGHSTAQAASPPTLSRCTRSFSSSSSRCAARISSCSRSFSCAQTPELATGSPRPPGGLPGLQQGAHVEAPIGRGADSAGGVATREEAGLWAWPRSAC